MAAKNESLLYLPPMLPTRDTFRNIIAHSESFLANDVFVPGGGYVGVQRFRFPYGRKIHCHMASLRESLGL